MRQNALKMAEMDYKTASSTMEALARISVSISLFTLTLLWLDWHGSSVFPHHYATASVFEDGDHMTACSSSIRCRGPNMSPHMYHQTWRGLSAWSFDIYISVSNVTNQKHSGLRPKSSLFIGWWSSLWRRDAGASDAKIGLKDKGNVMKEHCCLTARLIWGI